MSLNTRLAVPVALGVSLVSVTAFVVYYILKKDEDEAKKSVKTSRTNTIEIQVSKSIVPALIGRNGSNIKDIEKKSGARIHFKKFSDKDYDVCIIQGRTEAVQLAETFIHDFIKNQPIIIEDTMTVPGWSCGRIIGTGGESINDISHRSGARVKLEGGSVHDTTSMRQVTFRGTVEQIELAKELINKCISQEKCRREIEQSKRTSRHVQSPTNAGSSTIDTNGTSSSMLANTSTPSSPNTLNTPSEMPGDVVKQKHALRKSEVSGAAIEVYVSAVSSPSRFWVQFVGPQVAQLDELVDTMTEYYGHTANRERHALSSVSVGQVVAAVFRHDGRWYRARVSDIRDNEFDSTRQVADVFYVDYGDSEYVAVHELCELRADLLRLRFQAMECFLSGVRPASSERDSVAVTPAGQRWERWPAPAIEKFEELTQVARWKPLVSKTCSYKKSVSTDGEKEKEIPGIKLYDVTDEGELDIAASLISCGLAFPTVTSPRVSPQRSVPTFGDLGHSRVLGMFGERSDRASSLPKNHERNDVTSPRSHTPQDDKMSTSQSLGSGLETTSKQKTNTTTVELSEPQTSTPKTIENGSNDFLHSEKLHMDKENEPLNKIIREDLKANINRIDSHHGNLESLGRSHH